MNIKNKITVADILLISLLLAVAFLSFITLTLVRSDENGEYIKVTADFGTISFPLDADTEKNLSSGEYEYTLIIKDGRACIAEADCPDKLCSKTGWISVPGECVICVPGKLVITVVGGESKEAADDIVG